MSLPVIYPDAENRTDVSSIKVNKFTPGLRHGDDFEVFRLLEVHSMRERKASKSHGKPKILFEKYKEVFREYFPYGLLQIRSVDPEIQLKVGAKAIHRL